MKKLLFLTISIMTVLLSGCKTPTEDLSFSYDDTVVYTLTFRQDGQADIIREVEENHGIGNKRRSVCQNDHQGQKGPQGHMEQGKRR